MKRDGEEGRPLRRVREGDQEHDCLGRRMSSTVEVPSSRPSRPGAAGSWLVSLSVPGWSSNALTWTPPIETRREPSVEWTGYFDSVRDCDHVEPRKPQGGNVAKTPASQPTQPRRPSLVLSSPPIRLLAAFNRGPTRPSETARRPGRPAPQSATGHPKWLLEFDPILIQGEESKQSPRLFRGSN